jgi:hypothetical protein
MIETLYFRLEKLKVLGDDFIKYVSFFFIIVYKIFCNFLYILDGITCMHFLIISMMFDTSFGFTDRACTGTSDAASHQNCF